MKNNKGFIAALDQSGGSTPKALSNYGISANEYSSEDEMFDLIHQMRARIIKSPSFTSQAILGAILFEQTMEREIDGTYTAEYLWSKKGILPFLKVDEGLENEENGVQLMKKFKSLGSKMDKALKHEVFGTKMRSVIKSANPVGIKDIVEQQFEYGLEILGHGLVPILEPEVDIKSPDKGECEQILLENLIKYTDALPDNQSVVFKLTIPSVDNLYSGLVAHPKVMRIVALSGGYTREEANVKLAQNSGLIASFSRALVEGLNARQSDAEFDKMLLDSITSVYNASIT